MSMMRRVNREHKCPICQHDTWCLLGREVVVCMRVTSERTKHFQGGEVGYIHSYNGKPPPLPPAHNKVPTINTAKILREWRAAYGTAGLEKLAAELHVSVASLHSLEATRAPWPKSWSFPMKDGYGNYTGIRIRNEEGQKWAQPGSHAGIFVPTAKPQRRMLVVEGPTDTAAALSLGYYCIGRPSCSGGVPHILAHVRRCRINEVVVVCDNDAPGIRGAADLQRWLEVRSCMLVLPTKDLREFSRIGDKSTIDAMIDQLVWTEPRSLATSSPPQP